MDEFFHVDIQRNNFDFGWNYDDPGEVEPITRTSAFVPYVEIPEDWLQNGEGGSTGNENKKVLGFLRKESARSSRSAEFDRQQGFRHMLSERSRRERQKQSYDALISQLPNGTKKDKNSIVQSATKEILLLTREREELIRRFREMNGGEDSLRRGTTTNIKVRVMNPISGTDSLLVVLKCLLNLGVKTTTIRTEFSAGELSAVIKIENEIEAAEVEKVIQSALHEAERNLLFDVD